MLYDMDLVVLKPTLEKFGINCKANLSHLQIMFPCLQFLQMNSLVGFVGSIFNDGLHRIDDDDIDQVEFVCPWLCVFKSKGLS